MQKTVPLKLNRDYLRLYKRGKSFVNPSLVLYYSKNKLKMNRIGITTSKKIGKAVQRNRARRIIREAYRQIEPGTLTGYDFVFVARGRTVKLKSNDIKSIVMKMFSSAGVLVK
jgi:ribonuclease P protein component, eubacterial